KGSHRVKDGPPIEAGTGGDHQRPIGLPEALHVVAAIPEADRLDHPARAIYVLHVAEDHGPLGMLTERLSRRIQSAWGVEVVDIQPANDLTAGRLERLVQSVRLPFVRLA